jgi:hypothetical protein
LPHALIKKEFTVAFTKKSETEITKTLLSRHDVTQMFCARGDPKFCLRLDVEQQDGRKSRLVPEHPSIPLAPNGPTCSLFLFAQCLQVTDRSLASLLIHSW